MANRTRGLLAPLLTLLLAFAASVASVAEGDSPKSIKNSVGMNLVRLEPGEFTMGTTDAPPKSLEEFTLCDYDESPAHIVKIPTPFYLGATEVTNAQFEAFDAAHKAARGRRDISPGDNDPVVYVTWQQAVDFCRWLSTKEGRSYRLPTEAEWEFACRAGKSTVFHTGDALSADSANLGVTPEGKARAATVPVGSYPANAWGLFDMHGNVEEWCGDWYGPYVGGAQIDPVGPIIGDARVTRGGSYNNFNNRRMKSLIGSGRYCRSANRSGYLPDDANRAVGFRVVLGEMPTTKPRLVLLTSPGPKVLSKTSPATPALDLKKPYFDNFLTDGRRSTIAPNSWGPVFSSHNHYSTVCVCPNGDVLAAWYTTKSEAGHELAQAATRLPSGTNRWEAASSFLDIPDMNDHAPVLLTHGPRMFHFFGQGLSGWDDAAIALRTSDDSGATWSRPRIIWSRDEKIQLSQPCSAVVLKDGTFVLAVDGDVHRHERLLVSRNGGETWQLSEGDFRQASGDKYVIHPATTETSDGLLVTFLRGPNPMPLLVSRDVGRTFAVRETILPGIGTGQKSAALRLASGSLVLLSADPKRLLGGNTFVALSRDGGATWPHVRKLDDVNGYMSLAQDGHGLIYAVGSRLSVAAFNEAWLEEGGPLGKK